MGGEDEVMEVENCTTPIIAEAIGVDDQTVSADDQTVSAVQWSELPSELLSKIAEGLELIDLFGFRHVCKAWNSAAPFFCAEMESSVHDPWFLRYGENSQCLVLTNDGGKRYIDISELEGATCLASFLGWLLIFRQGNMFFFSPFSRARIDLPDFPLSSLSDYIAAFSSPPTSQDCTVVICRINESNIDGSEIELNMLRRGETGWTKLNFDCELHNLKAAAYHTGYFQFLDDENHLLNFSPKERVVHPYILVNSTDHHRSRKLEYQVIRRPFIGNEIGKQLEDSEYSNINTCGTLTKFDKLYFNESESINTYSEDIPSEDISRIAKGVWIEPRFHQISKGQSWAR